MIKGKELKRFKDLVENFDLVDKRTPVLYLWTESGALLHAKSLGTKEAWSVYKKLIKTYFLYQESQDKKEKLVFYSYKGLKCTTVRQVAKNFRCDDGTIQDYLGSIIPNQDYIYIMGEDLKAFKREFGLSPNTCNLYLILVSGLHKAERYLTNLGYQAKNYILPIEDLREMYGNPNIPDLQLLKFHYLPLADKAKSYFNLVTID